jgi:hypothetical protein
MCPIREDVIGNGPPPLASGCRPRSSSPCPAASRCRAAAFSNSTSASLWAEPRWSISREPRREESTICTAVAPEDVFTVRTYGGTRPHYCPDNQGYSAQIPDPTRTNLQVNVSGSAEVRDRDQSRV